MKKSVACRDTALPKISWCKTCQHFEEGVEFERERIIAIIKKDCQHPKFGGRCSHSHLLEEIEAELIKGEN